jgi:dienelactone hydrolase
MAKDAPSLSRSHRVNSLTRRWQKRCSSKEQSISKCGHPHLLPQRLVADKAYGSRKFKHFLRRRGIQPIDAISALRSLQEMDIIEPEGIGMWGHSMAGNLVLRALLVEPDVKAGVIWAGAVYSYDDFVQYAIPDTSFVRREGSPSSRRSQEIFETYGRPDTAVPFWQAVSLTENIEYLDSPLQIHHAVDDEVVNVGYSRALAKVLKDNEKLYSSYEYESGGHNITSLSFEVAAMQNQDDCIKYC